jgi:hypothetical protein
LLSFHATLHARSPEVSQGVALELNGLRVTTLVVPVAALAHSFSISFEQAVEALERLERMFVEPDGSFVWVSSDANSDRWQVDGNLFDRNGRLLMVDLKGTCTEAEFERLLSAFGWPETAVIFELTREAVFLDQAEFRRYSGHQ